LDRDLGPAAGRRAQIDDSLARLQQPRLVVDLAELERRARTQATPLGLVHIGIVELARQPLARRRLVRLAVHPHRREPPAAFLRRFVHAPSVERPAPNRNRRRLLPPRSGGRPGWGSQRARRARFGDSTGAPVAPMSLRASTPSGPRAKGARSTSPALRGGGKISVNPCQATGARSA